MSYIEYTFTFSDPAADPEMLIAFLNAYNYEGFQESDDQMIAYLPESKKDEKLLAQLLEQVGNENIIIGYTSRRLPDINWNAKWESDFLPVEIDDFVRIRASFHGKDETFVHDIIIDPKMSFGTGHHATTRLMMRAMRTLDFSRKKVADLGCGTAVLSILASRMGAAGVLAVDIDEWAVSNSRDNIENNNCSNIVVKRGDIDVAGNERFDIVLANINRNVLLESMCRFRQLLPGGGTLVLSGIMLNDRDIITVAAENSGFRAAGIFSENDWCALVFRNETAG
ncbi:MAG: 50S ribosomal protein L11 methyltransferase [Bacteroidales bacterium]|nr:50S ribosomal protein L11 methyltransferase [Bacteroidales bacterium]MDT8430028.1 50S ribosomal protein L11 methyltransferase [Bacteroidales bacterium]